MLLPADVREPSTAQGLSEPPAWGELAARRLAEAGPQPWLTYLDGATGERTELSHATFDNWVAKTANMLIEDAEIDHGDRILVALDGHWTAPVVLHACGRAGALAAIWCAGDPSPEAGRAAVVHEQLVSETGAGEPLYVVGDGMGGRLLGDGPWRAFGEDVLAYADDYDDPDVLASAELLAVRVAETGLDFDQVAALACGAALLDLGVEPGDRLLLAGPADRADLLLVGLGAYAAGAAVVLGRRLAAAAVWRHAAQERAAWIVAAPDQLSGLVAAAEVGPDLRGVLCTGPVEVTDWQQATERLGVPVCPAAGVAAGGFLSALTPLETAAPALDWLADQPGRLAGTAAGSTRWTVLGADGQPVAQDGESGELAVGGPQVASAIEPPPSLAERWLRTGERGTMPIGPDGQAWLLLD